MHNLKLKILYCTYRSNKIVFDKNSTIQIIPKHRAQDIDDLQDWKFVEKLFLINKETINK